VLQSHLTVFFYVLLLCSVGGGRVYAQEPSLEQRQPLELIYVDSIVPQDLREMMLTTGAWYSKSGDTREALLTEKVEWGISDRLQISTFVNVFHSSNAAGSRATGMGDFEIGARYTWARVRSRFTHIALAVDAGLPTGDQRKGLGEGAYTVAPSLLVSRELSEGKYQIFSTTGADFVLAHRQLVPPLDERPHMAEVGPWPKSP
jgi:Putative MetA-pathway of phenol degradation